MSVKQWVRKNIDMGELERNALRGIEDMKDLDYRDESGNYVYFVQELVKSAGSFGKTVQAFNAMMGRAHTSEPSAAAIMREYTSNMQELERTLNAGHGYEGRYYVGQNGAGSIGIFYVMAGHIQ